MNPGIFTPVAALLLALLALALQQRLDELDGR